MMVLLVLILLRQVLLFSVLLEVRVIFYLNGIMFLKILKSKDIKLDMLKDIE